MLEPKRPLAEHILTLSVGPTRAAAILGDLTEMAATRGRAWFVAAYLRTLVSLTWRLVLALFAAEVCREFIFDSFHIYLQHAPAAWRTASGPYLNLLNGSGPLLACILSTLWFALPFAAVRYGVRDRFVRLTFAIALGTTVAFYCIPIASAIAAAATLTVAGATLLSRSWRRAAVALAAVGLSGLAALAAAAWLMPFVVLFLHRHLHLGYPTRLPMLAFQASLLLIAIVCSTLHSRLFDPSPRPSTAA
jgi:hypothetical protein